MLINNLSKSDDVYQPEFTTKVYSPVTKKHIYDVVKTSGNEVDNIVNNAVEEQKKWQETTYQKRREILKNYQQLIKENEEVLTTLIRLENGKLLTEAQAEIQNILELVDYAISIPNLLNLKSQTVSRGINVHEVIEPVGIVIIITPFNFPLMVAHWNMINAIMLGNAVVIKPSTQTPMAILKAAKLLISAGVPKGVINIVYGEEEVVTALIEHKKTNAITFVGSSEVAKIIYQKSAMNLKRCLALGAAKNCLIVTPEVQVTETVTEILNSAFGMGGQRCMAASMLILVGKQAELKQQLIKRASEMTEIAEIVNESNHNLITNFVAKHHDKVLLNGVSSKKIYPTIIEHQTPETIGDEEIFGPVLEIINVATINEAITIQNSLKYANGASIYSEQGIVLKLAEKLTSGMIGINIGVPVPRIPFGFGGLKYSKFGYGDITGYDSISFLTNKKKITAKWNFDDRIDWMS